MSLVNMNGKKNVEKLEKDVKILFVLMLTAIIAWGILSYTAGENVPSVPVKPTILVSKINGITPRIFFTYNEKIMPLNDSKIFSDYINSKLPGEENNKYIRHYGYVYIIQYETKSQREAAYAFSRKNYLKSHPNDAVDKKVIFSDQLPSQEIFNVILDKNIQL